MRKSQAETRIWQVLSQPGLQSDLKARLSDLLRLSKQKLKREEGWNVAQRLGHCTHEVLRLLRRTGEQCEFSGVCKRSTMGQSTLVGV